MKNRYGAGRTTGTRPILPIIEVVCDDTRTAVAYFNLLKQEVSGKKVVKVVPAPSDGTSADQVIELASTPSDLGDEAFVLVDLDTNPNVSSARDKATAKRVTLLVSNPCFEVWTLAHLQDTGEAFLDCNAVLARLKQKWKDAHGSEMGPKAQARYEKLAVSRHVALERCKRRNPDTNQSWTEVWRVVEAILA
jgi:hypothetical protein